MPACGSPRLIAACHVLHRLLLPRHPPCALSSLTIKFTPRIPLRVLRLPPPDRSPRRLVAATLPSASGTLVCKSHVAFPSFTASHDAIPMGYLALIKFLLDAVAGTTADDASACDSHRRRSVDLPDLFSCQTSSLSPACGTAALSGSGLRRTDLCPMFDANLVPAWRPTLSRSCCSRPFGMNGGADRDRTGDPLLAKQVLSQLSYSPVKGWWAWVESNYRPHPYQGCALAN